MISYPIAHLWISCCKISSPSRFYLSHAGYSCTLPSFLPYSYFWGMYAAKSIVLSSKSDDIVFKSLTKFKNVDLVYDFVSIVISYWNSLNFFLIRVFSVLSLDNLSSYSRLRAFLSLSSNPLDASSTVLILSLSTELRMSKLLTF